MATVLQTDLDRSLSHRSATLPDDARVRCTAAALEANGFAVRRAADAAAARRVVLDLILERDRAAVAAAVAERWSNGQTEGRVLRLKLIKRQGYGRAKVDLLRQRVLRAA